MEFKLQIFKFFKKKIKHKIIASDSNKDLLITAKKIIKKNITYKNSILTKNLDYQIKI